MKKADLEAMVETETEKFKKGMIFGAQNSKLDERQLMAAMLCGELEGLPKIKRADARKMAAMFRNLADAIEEEVGEGPEDE